MSRGWTVYILRCADGSLYTGVTTDLGRRLAQHNAGTASACTRARRPVALAWKRSRFTRAAALRRESAIKKLPRAEKLHLLAGRSRARRP